MNYADKSEFLRARVSKQTKSVFEDICAELGKTATEQLREIIEAFVRREYGRLRDRVTVHIYRPAGYDLGAWRVTIKLRNPDEATWGGAAVPFALPNLPKRRISSDPEYTAVLFRGDQLDLGGKFVKGEWRGHLYSNGCPESENPTSVDTVREALASTIDTLVTRFTSDNA